MVGAAKALLVLASLAGVAMLASDEGKEKPLGGNGPNGQPLPPGILCEAPNGAVIICHEFQPTALAALANTWTTIGSGNQYPTVGISLVPVQGSIPIPQWIAQQLQAGRLVLIACDGARKELIACERGEELILCPRNPLRNAVLCEPGAGQGQNPNGPGVPTPGPGVPQPQPQPQPQPGGYPFPGMPGGVPQVPQVPQMPTAPGGWIPDLSSPTPPVWWPQGAPWPPFGGGTPQPGPQQPPGVPQPFPPQPQPQPQPGPTTPTGVQPPPGWPAGWPYPPFGVPLPDFNGPKPAWWPPVVPWPGAGGGGALPTTPTPGQIDRSWKVPTGQVLAKGPDGYWRHVIRPGDIGTMLAQHYAGSAYKAVELEQTNPELVRVFKDGKVIGWSPWQVGQVLILPLTWDGSKGPAGFFQGTPQQQSALSFWTAPSTRNAAQSGTKQSLSNRVAAKRAPAGRAPTGRKA